MKPQVVLSTTNLGKVVEIRDAIGDLVDLVDRPAGLPDVVEDAPDLEGNARLKAEAIADATGLATLADDTGLEVDALGGAPGVLSARYAGPAEDAEANKTKVLSELSGVADRSARFRTVLVLSVPGGGEIVAHGVVEGTIAETRRGEHGFGYDSIFVPDGDRRTFAEMPLEDKQQRSHRARALSDLMTTLRSGPPGFLAAD